MTRIVSSPRKAGIIEQLIRESKRPRKMCAERVQNTRTSGADDGNNEGSGWRRLEPGYHAKPAGEARRVLACKRKQYHEEVIAHRSARTQGRQCRREFPRVCLKPI